MNHLKLWIGVSLLASVASGAEIEPTWESLAAHYQVPDWFVDGKIGVWMHWGISSAADENRPNDGSWYGRNMYGGGKSLAKTLSEYHTERYGPPSEFGYEKLVPELLVIIAIIGIALFSNVWWIERKSA